MSQIEGKVVAITGGSSGLGESTARLLAEKGAKVFIGARREDNLEQIVSGIRENGGEAGYGTVDVTRRDQVEQFVEDTVNRFGRIDVLVNNADTRAS